MARVSELWLLDATTNREVLGRLAYGVRERARVILDLWSAEFLSFIRSIDFKTPGGVVRESKHVDEDRLFVHLDYPDGGEDSFEWQSFTPARMISMAESIGFGQLLACTAFDETTPPSPTNPRVQFVFERCRD
ncbi:MAG TPA: hypothetical protein VFO22_05775 [Candidatus Udaeobacter sp.]|nr:hypothetical protein [Candidatus Udaeobacter sp.]